MSVEIIAVGWACPLGLSSLPSFAAVRAGLREIEALDDDANDDDDDDDDDRLVCRLASNDDGHHDPGRSRGDRAGFFAAYALTELLGDRLLPTVPAVCLASPEPGPSEGLDVAAVWAKLRTELPHELATALPQRVQLFASGRAGVFEALAAARELLERGVVGLAIVGGFDSMVDTETLSASATAERPADRRSADRLVPGEGAAFLLLTRSGTANDPALAQLADLALAREPEPYALRTPSRGAGLTAAFAELRRRHNERVDVVHLATPGRGWWARELNYAYLRNAELMPEPLVLANLYEHIGDLGAAAGAAALVAAIRGLNPLLRGRQPDHRSALVYACSDTGVVGACRLGSGMVMTQPRTGRSTP